MNMVTEFLILLCIGIIQEISGSIPVVIWGSEKQLDYFAPPLKKFSMLEFSDVIDKIIPGNAHNVALFVEDAFSIEDFRWKDSNERSAYPNIEREIAKDGSSKFFAYVKNPVDVFKTLAESGYKISNFDHTSNSSKHLFIIKFDEAGNNEDRSALLKRHDLIIHETCNKIKATYKDAICVLTGSRSSWSEPSLIAPSRRLLQISDATSGQLNFFLAKPRGLFYTKQPPLFQDTKNNVFYNATFEDPATGSLKNQSVVTLSTLAKLKSLNGTGKYDDKSIKLIFSFSSPSFSKLWHLDYINGYIPYDDVSSVSLKTTTDISGSYGFSYHTPSPVVFSSDDFKLTFYSLQVELFNNTEQSYFSSAEDTVGFFTIPIWSGLFVSSILVTIALVGLSLLFDIKTMDQFDDPKGKTITINAAE